MSLAVDDRHRQQLDVRHATQHLRDALRHFTFAGHLLNPLAKDCLVIEKCFPQWNHIDPDSASHVAALVIDAARTDDAQMFRPSIVNKRPVILTKELADKLKGFTVVRIRYLPR